MVGVSRIPTMPPQQSARCFRFAGDGAADGGGARRKILDE